jgi:hypothetical protein
MQAQQRQHRKPGAVLAAWALGLGFLLAGPQALAQAGDPGAARLAASQHSATFAAAFAAAQHDLSQFINHQLQRGSAPEGFPFDVQDLRTLKDARIGYGFPVYTVDPDQLLNGRGKLKSMARHANQWRFVVLLGERPIGLATVERQQGGFETVAYGAAVLSKDLDALANAHGNADRSNLRLLRLYQARSDLLEVETAGGARYAPLFSARASLPLQRADAFGRPTAALAEEAELLPALRAAVKRNLGEHR